MIILLDCDDVLAQFTQGVIDVLNRKLGHDFDINDVTDWDMAHSLGVSNNVIFGIAGEEGFCVGLDVMPGAKEGVEKLRQYGEIYVVTSPIHTSRTWQFERTKWLHKHFDIPASRVIQTSAKHLIFGDVFIDDRVSHVTKWLNYQSVEASGYVLDVPWPRSRDESALALYKDNWGDLLNGLEMFTHERSEEGL